MPLALNVQLKKQKLMIACLNVIILGLISRLDKFFYMLYNGTI